MLHVNSVYLWGYGVGWIHDKMVEDDLVKVVKHETPRCHQPEAVSLPAIYDKPVLVVLVGLVLPHSIERRRKESVGSRG
jgi:hypothetical protein